jgi:dTDP-4-amino-4,6-dideoxygalactose transaminase
MNAAGFGVVSLYHTMIEQIAPERYPHSHAISHCILNLPVHQDASPDDMKAMIRTLALLLEESRCIA